MGTRDRVNIKNNPVYKFFSKNGILVALIVLCVLLALATNRFFSVNNITNIMLQSATTSR